MALPSRVVSLVSLLSGLLCVRVADADPPRPFLFGCGRYTAAWAGRPWSYDQQIWDRQVSIGVTITGAGLAWVDAEPVRGQYNWDAINYADFQVDQIRARGMEPTFFVGLTPQWAALRPDLPPHRTPPAEDYVVDFMNFHRFVADHFRGRVRYYFFWNEPNGCSWINDGCANGDSYPLYTRWLIRCSQAIKGVDPDAKMIGANLDYHSGVAQGYLYIQGMYNYGAGPWIDGISIHPYDWAGTIHWRAVTDTRNVMVANGDGAKGIWITEYGWNSGDEQEKATKLTQVLTELKKPEYSYVVQANYLVLNDGPGVENYGLTDANLNPRPAYYAFRDFDKTFPVSVDFTADVRVGPAPLTVQFTDQSGVAGATAWAWDFGDGATSDLRNPSHTYTQEGTFTVRLSVTGAAGTETGEKAAFIRVGSFPKVAFIGGQVPPTVSDAQIVSRVEAIGLLVDVYDDEPANRPAAAEIAATHDLVMCSSTTLSANVAGEFRHQTVPFIFWESALGWTSREAIGEGAYAAPGQTQLNIVDNGHPILEGIPAGPVTLTTAGADFSYCTGIIAPGVRVLATAVGNPDWRTILVAEPGAALLDGGVAADKRIMLFFYDTTWLSANATAKKIFDNAVAYALGPPSAGFHATGVVGPPPRTVVFADDSTGPVTSWSWDFGDGGTSTLRNPSHTYTQPGTYDVTLTVTGPGRSDAYTRTAYVRVIPWKSSDFDNDDDTDLADFAFFQSCFNGPNRPAPLAECSAVDLDSDQDIDLADFARFQSCFNGPNRPVACP